MKSFHIKSILLGIGIGTILTAIISMIYMAGVNPGNVKLTDQEIIERAKSLGMFEAKSILAGSGTSDTKIESDVADNGASTKTKNVDTSQKPASITQKATTTQAKVTPQPNKAESILSIEVVKGDTSEKVGEKLFEANLISDKKAFIDELTKKGLTMDINIGKYRLKKSMGIIGIIKILTSNN